MFDLDASITAWRSFLRYRRGFFEEDLDELEQHVRDQVTGLMVRGYTEEAAFHRALREMGAVHVVEEAYRDVYWGKLKRKRRLFHTYLNHLAMFKNYLKLAGRNLLKNKMASVINLGGLSLAIGCSIVVFLFADVSLNRDTAHEHAERIFLIESLTEGNGEVQFWGDTPKPLGPRLAADFPQVEQAVRVAAAGAAVQYQETVFEEAIWFVDPAFLDVFTFPLKYGDATALSDPNALVLREELAVKYFGQANPLGQEMVIHFNDTLAASFVVRGVAEKFPLNASIGFNILMRYEQQRLLGLDDLEDWESLTAATFIQVQNPADIPALEAQSAPYLAQQNAANRDRLMTGFRFNPLLNISRTAFEVRNSISNGSPPATIITLGALGLFLLLLACFNYVNIALASANRRMKEIGIRKVVGSTKTQLITQFLTENLLLCVAALLAGFLLAEFFFFPGFLAVLGSTASLSLVDFFDNPRLWGFFAVVLLLTGVGSGAYPAFYIARFQPVKIFRGKQVISGKKPLTHALLIFQFVLAFITLAGSLAIAQNNAYQRDRDWGYNEAQTLVVPVDNGQDYTLLKYELHQHPGVAGLAGAVHHVGRTAGRALLERGVDTYDVARFDVGPRYFDALRLRLKAGRAFDPDRSTDLDAAIMINETLAQTLGWVEGSDLHVTYGSQRYAVIGVVEDFHHTWFNDKIEPAILRLAEEETFRYLALTAKAERVVQTADHVEATWKQLFPDRPYEGFYQDQVFEAFFSESDRFSKMFLFTAMLGLLLACMGLYGLVSLNIAKRMKEMSIRKVLGASMLQMTRLLNKELLFLLSLATLIGVPLGYFLIDSVLEAVYAYRLALGAVPFVLTTLSLFLTALLTISSLIYKAIIANPVTALRSE